MATAPAPKLIVKQKGFSMFIEKYGIDNTINFDSQRQHGITQIFTDHGLSHYLKKSIVIKKHRLKEGDVIHFEYTEYSNSLTILIHKVYTVNILDSFTCELDLISQGVNKIDFINK